MHTFVASTISVKMRPPFSFFSSSFSWLSPPRWFRGTWNSADSQLSLLSIMYPESLCLWLAPSSSCFRKLGGILNSFLSQLCLPNVSQILHFYVTVMLLPLLSLSFHLSNLQIGLFLPYLPFSCCHQNDLSKIKSDSCHCPSRATKCHWI